MCIYELKTPCHERPVFAGLVAVGWMSWVPWSAASPASGRAGNSVTPGMPCPQGCPAAVPCPHAGKAAVPCPHAPHSLPVAGASADLSRVSSLCPGTSGLCPAAGPAEGPCARAAAVLCCPRGLPRSPPSPAPSPCLSPAVSPRPPAGDREPALPGAGRCRR